MVKLILQSSFKANKLLEEVICEIELKEKENKYFSFPISKQLSRCVGTFKSKKCYGKCIKNTYEPYKIALNELLLEHGTEHQIKSVILHELIHTIPSCFNHKWQFKNYAWKACNVLGYDALHARYENVLPFIDRKATAKYKITCSKCGYTFYRQRKSNITEHPEHYHHAKCGGSFIVEEIK